MEARYKGRSKYYPGEIVRVRSDGTYDIDYDDGEKETRVGSDLIKVLGKSGGRSKKGFNVGEKVEALYKGRSKYYPGRIARVREDGTYDIDYDDGEKESRVREDLIRSLEKRSSSPSKRGAVEDASDSERDGGLVVGARVEARYKGRSKYYPGEIVRVRSDGTYDIDYDDDKKEIRVSDSFIRLLVAEHRHSKSTKYTESSDSDVSLSKPLRVYFVSPNCVKYLRSMCTEFNRRSTTSTCRMIFNKLDPHNSGYVSRSEFNDGLRAIFQATRQRRTFDELFSTDDIDALCSSCPGPRKGSLDYDNFMLFVFDQEESTELRKLHLKLQRDLMIKSKLQVSDLVKVFNKHDARQKGFLKLVDFEKDIQNLNRNVSPNDIKLLSKRWCLSDDDVVDYFGFSSWVGCGNDIDALIEKVKLQMRQLDSQHVRKIFDTERGKSNGLSLDGIAELFSHLGLVVASIEVIALFEHFDSDGSSSIDVSSLHSLLDDSPQRKRRRSNAESTRNVLLAPSIFSYIGEAVKEYLSVTEKSLWKILTEHDEQKIGQLTKRQYRKFLSQLTIHLDDVDENTLFDCLDMNEKGSVDPEDLVSLFTTLAYNGDDTEAVSMYTNLGDTRNVNIKEIGRALLKSDAKHDGFVDPLTFETKLKRFYGSGVSDDVMKFYTAFLKTKKSGYLDVGYFVSLMVVSTNPARAERKLRHCLALLEGKGISWKGILSENFSDSGSVSSINELAREIKAFGCPIVESEIFAVIGKYQKKGRINVPNFIVQFEKVEVGKVTPSKAASVNKGGSDLFGKSMYSKICRLRANKDKSEHFRSSILQKDSTLTGSVSQRDFLHTLDIYFEFTDQEAALLCENLAFIDEKRDSGIDYSLLLLILMEPFSKSPNNAGIALVSKVRF